MDKSLFDYSWRIFTTMLKYKVELVRKELVKIDKFYLSSNTSSICGRIKQDLKVLNRAYTCKCNYSINRNLNGSIT